MKGFFVYNSLLIGLMIFSMTFGAGNLIYPLAAGYQAGNMVGWCALGFFVSSIFLPWLGLCAVMVYQGDYRRLLYENLPQTALAESLIFCSMLLLGPLGCIPRCALTAYAGVVLFPPAFGIIMECWFFRGMLFFGMQER